MNIYLKANDATAFFSAMDTAGLVQDGEIVQFSHNHALDILGVIYTQGTYDTEGNTITAPEALPGYHANLKTNDTALAEKLASLTIPKPATPARVWAGEQ